MSTSTFSADWLRMREPFDAAAREEAAAALWLTSRLSAWRAQRCEPWRVIDLACGTGANLRWLAPRLGGLQQWLVVDHDAQLLHHWPEHLAPADGPSGVPAGLEGGLDLSHPLRLTGAGFDAAIVRQQMDLMERLEALPWHAAELVTASALLDLVGLDWLHRLVRAGAASGAALLMSLNVDGRHVWAPEDTLDDTVGRLFADHQRRDKGLGPALGLAAVDTLKAALGAAGYRVFSAASDWHVDGSAGAQPLALQCALIDGMASAACEQSSTEAPEVRAWRQRRLALAHEARLHVGHLDVLALPG
jgi:SAM-dependent methyltransferase